MNQQTIFRLLIRHPLVWSGIGIWLRYYDTRTEHGRSMQQLGTAFLVGGAWHALSEEPMEIPFVRHPRDMR